MAGCFLYLHIMSWKIIGLLLLGNLSAMAQHYRVYDATDTNKPIQLDEVIILHHPDIFEDSTLAFYQSSRLSSLDKLLHHMPDVKQISRGPFAREPMIHGMHAGQIKVTIDGMHIYGACTDKMDPVTAYVEPANLKDIELGAGAAGMAFGPTIGGSLNLHTADPGFSQQYEWSGMVSSDFHSASNGKDIGMQWTASHSHWATEVTSTYRQHQAYRAGGGEIVPHSQYEKLNLSWTGKWLAGKRHLLKADVIYDDGWDIGYPGLPMDVGLAQARIAGVDHTYFPAGKALQRLHSKVYANWIHHRMDDSQREVVMHMDMPGYSQTTGAFSEAFWTLGDGHELMAKADVHRHYAWADMTMYPDHESPMYMLTWPHTRRWVGGLFFQYSYHMEEHAFQLNARTDYANTKLTTSLGRQHWAVFGEDLSGADQRMSYSISGTWAYALTHRHKFNAVLGYSERLPTLSEQYGYYLYNAQDGYDYIGNPHLSNERAWQATLQYLCQGHHSRLSVKGYYYHIADYIFGAVDPSLSAMTLGANGVKRYHNVPFAHIAGMSASYHLHLSTHWSFIGNAEYLTGWLDDGEPVPQIPPFMGVMALRYKGERWFIQGESDWALAKEQVNHAFGEHPSHGHAIWNLRGVYEWKMMHMVWEAELAIENITDQYYHLFLDWGQIPRAGRNVQIGVEVHF